jgi:uncharacterized LabA/DUF88 family protein
MADRAVVFVDGNNWYHSLRDAGVADLGRLDYGKVARKLLGPRDWTGLGLRYYIGRVPNAGNPQLYADQRRFLANLVAQDSRISVHYGRLEPRWVKNDAAIELADYLHKLPLKIDSKVFHDLLALAKRHREAEIMVEKAVDVMLAVDMVIMAERNEFDCAYVLSADGDYTHAVQAVRAHNKKVYAASASNGAQLAAAVNAFIKVDSGWLAGCYL